MFADDLPCVGLGGFHRMNSTANDATISVEA